MAEGTADGLCVDLESAIASGVGPLAFTHMKDWRSLCSDVPSTSQVLR